MRAGAPIRCYTQEDPIGLAGGVNVYGFAQGDPVNFADPFGLKVCFSGTHTQQFQLAAATRIATNTSFDLDSGGCVENAQSRGDSSFDAVRSGFFDLVNDEATYTVQYSADAWSAQDPLNVNIFSNYGALAYPARVNGRCERGQQPWNLAQVVGHELFHHYSVPRLGRMNPDENAAVHAENIVNRSRGWRIRCEY